MSGQASLAAGQEVERCMKHSSDEQEDVKTDYSDSPTVYLAPLGGALTLSSRTAFCTCCKTDTHTSSVSVCGRPPSCLPVFLIAEGDDARIHEHLTSCRCLQGESLKLFLISISQIR